MEWNTTSTLLDGLRDLQDDRAWTRVDSFFREAFLRYARGRGLLADDADDAVQLAMSEFARAYREGKYDPSRGKLRSYLHSFIRTHVNNVRRSVARDWRRTRANPVESIPPMDEIAEEEDQESWEREWNRAVYERCISKLREEVGREQFEIFRLTVFENLSGQAIAERLDVSRDVVYSTRYRVMKRLPALLKDFEDV